MEKYEKIIKLMNNFELIPGKITEIRQVKTLICKKFILKDKQIYTKYEKILIVYFKF